MQLLIPLSQIEDNPYQTRRHYDDVDELAGRIAAVYHQHQETLGLLQVPLGRLIGDDGYPIPLADLEPDEISSELEKGWLAVQLAFGHRRLRAFRWLHRNNYPGHLDGVMPVRLSDLSDEQMLDACWSENRERRDLSAVEEAELLASKMRDGRTQRDVAAMWGLGRSTVANRLRLLEANEAIQDANRAGTISERQALALLTVQRIGEALRDAGRDGEIEWGATVHPRQMGYYDKPCPPGQFEVAATQDGAEVLTADVIREYIRLVLDHAGEYLPPAVADFDAGNVDEVQQATCSGCPFRMNEACLKPPCLQLKKAAFGEQVAREAAAEMDLPYSDEVEHFTKVADANLEWKVMRLWEKHPLELAQRGVVGWYVGGHAARPFYDTIYARQDDVYGPVTSYSDKDADVRAGVAIGWKGDVEDLRAIIQSANGQKPGEEEPVDELDRHREQWDVKAEASQQRAEKGAKAALQDWLADKITPYALAVIVRLWKGPNAIEPFDVEFLDEDKLLERLVKGLWRGGYFDWNVKKAPVFYVRAMHELLAAIDQAHVLADEMTAEAEAVRWLACWAECRNDSWRAEREAEKLAPLLPDILYRVEAAILEGIDYNPPDPELNTLYDCLKLAEEEVRTYVGDEDETEEDEAEAVPA